MKQSRLSGWGQKNGLGDNVCENARRPDADAAGASPPPPLLFHCPSSFNETQPSRRRKPSTTKFMVTVTIPPLATGAFAER